MSETLQMSADGRFGSAARARLNRPLMEALRTSMAGCERCREIEKEIDGNPDGGEYVESPSFRGTSVEKLDAHFRSHWRDRYELVERSRRG